MGVKYLLKQVQCLANYIVLLELRFPRKTASFCSFLLFSSATKKKFFSAAHLFQSKTERSIQICDKSEYVLLSDVSDAIFEPSKSLKILNKSFVQASGDSPFSMWFFLHCFNFKHRLSLSIVFIIGSYSYK